MMAFEGMPLRSLLDVDMTAAVSFGSHLMLRPQYCAALHYMARTHYSLVTACGRFTSSLFMSVDAGMADGAG